MKSRYEIDNLISQRQKAGLSYEVLERYSTNSKLLEEDNRDNVILECMDYVNKEEFSKARDLIFILEDSASPNKDFPYN
jgi:hypothetical protein